MVFPSSVENISPTLTNEYAAALRRWGEALHDPLDGAFALPFGL